jgi:hypothetical protein
LNPPFLTASVASWTRRNQERGKERAYHEVNGQCNGIEGKLSQK